MDQDGLEFRRQMFHFTLGMVIAFAVLFATPVFGKAVMIPLLLASALMLIIPKLKNVKFHDKLLFHFERRKDAESFPFKGAFWYGVGVLFPIFFIQDVHAACAIIAVLSAGDSASTLVGKFYGKIRIGEKSVEGFLAFAAAGFLAAMLFQVDTMVALKLAVAGAVIEFIPSSKIDDNFSIPVGLTAFYYLFFIVV